MSDNDYGRQRFAQMMEYIPTSSLSLIGVSHAASESLVMKAQMKRWLEEQFPSLRIVLLPQHRWWL